MSEPRCPIHNPVNRTRALIAFEIIRAVLVLAIMGWWGWLLVASGDEQTRHMLFWEAITLCTLVGISTALSLWFYLRDLRRSRSLQSFFAAMAHELRTPLSSIRLQAESLKRKTKSPSPYISRLIEDTSRLEAQVERGLELARAESGTSVSLSKVALEDSWRQAASLFAETDRARLKINKEPSGFVMADAQALQTIFRNLIENTLLHSGRKTPSVSVETASGNGLTILTFRDNGAGAADRQKQLGTLFAKGAKSKGTGLGLYLIRSLMRLQGGSARFDGRDGFTATLVFKGVPDA